MKRSQEFENFDSTMRKLLAIPHSEIKAKLDAEKAEKQKRKDKKKASAGTEAEQK
jgi:hypothetical protein